MGTVVAGGPPASPLLTVLAETVAVARAAQRGDLVGRLEALADRVRDPRRRIVVAGLGNQGKSRFVNALLNLEVCPVGDDATTTVPTLLAHGPQPVAELVLAGPGGAAEGRRITVPLADIHGSIHRERASRLEIRVPNPLLADGIVLIDTPAVGGHGTAGATAVLGLVPTADAVLVLSDASAELTETEVEFLRQVRELCPAVALLLSKIDLYPHWRQVLQADREHLCRHRLELPIIPVSSVLRTHALRWQDEQLGRESGFGVLYDFLRGQVVARDQAATRRAVAADIASAAEHLALALGSELVALRDPGRGAAAIRELRLAKTQAEDLHRRTAAWQQTLGDGITDLVADIDHDLRDRLRTIGRTAEDWIDANDPGRLWEQMREWLTTTADSALGDNLLCTHHRAVGLAERIAEHFLEFGGVDLPSVRDVLNPTDSRIDAVTLAELEPDLGPGHKLLVGMRGSYGGMVMVGLVSTVAGLALVNPVSVGAGMLLGGKAFRDDKRERLVRRRAEAKTAVRRFLDDVAFEAGKQSRDRLHRIHRVLRDHFTGIADRSLRSINDSLQAAQDAAGIESARRAERAGELERQLQIVAELRRHAAAMTPPGVEPTGDSRTH
ncbi:dynamin family protein [Nocardia terpenica]|uniref:dynamin family protein n=1 Tax=Nocardia terpenica TaxID=455432 RepID=UPI001895A908|nr:dynamin family protein [Nocardia terpenica]MBF6062754.1 dynamin family protein [Nocardia terpenica]MBF6105111.1 dynamin family protein [Nocardia terpenica]MBF6112452.1 dynamin family protein [Nocardia terpenica]MBF6118839.1 dynamin family protein [Nocardia terpenica]MBF6154308.1 dynamin family protein [Nocardia terpenica]